MTNPKPDTSKEAVGKVCHAAHFADNDAGIPQMVELIKALTAERDTLQATVKEMREALEKVREDINWMQNNGKLLNDFVFGYIDTTLAKHKEQDHG